MSFSAYLCPVPDPSLFSPLSMGLTCGSPETSLASRTNIPTATSWSADFERRRPFIRLISRAFLSFFGMLCWSLVIWISRLFRRLGKSNHIWIQIAVYFEIARIARVSLASCIQTIRHQRPWTSGWRLRVCSTSPLEFSVGSRSRSGWAAVHVSVSSWYV